VPFVVAVSIISSSSSSSSFSFSFLFFFLFLFSFPYPHQLIFWCYQFSFPCLFFFLLFIFRFRFLFTFYLLLLKENKIVNFFYSLTRISVVHSTARFAVLFLFPFIEGLILILLNITTSYFSLKPTYLFTFPISCLCCVFWLVFIVADATTIADVVVILGGQVTHVLMSLAKSSTFFNRFVKDRYHLVWPFAFQFFFYFLLFSFIFCYFLFSFFYSIDLDFVK
jgi:hypothetical protein